MKRLWILIGLVTTAWVSLSAWTTEEILHRVDDITANSQGLEFSFSQSIQFPELNMNQTSKGTGVLAKGGRFRFSNEFPQKRVTICNGKKFWIYNPRENQVWVGTWASWLSSQALPKGLLPLDNYTQDLKTYFNLTYKEVDSPASEVAIHAKPKEPGIDYEMTIYFSVNSWLPVRTLYQSNSTKIDTVFTDQKVLSNVAADLFRFSPPTKAEVISFN